MCRSMSRSVGTCAHVLEHVHMYGSMCTCAGPCAEVWEHVHMCERMCICVRACGMQNIEISIFGMTCSRRESRPVSTVLRKTVNF